jgi:hypothetical protein
MREVSFGAPCAYFLKSNMSIAFSEFSLQGNLYLYFSAVAFGIPRHRACKTKSVKYIHNLHKVINQSLFSVVLLPVLIPLRLLPLLQVCLPHILRTVHKIYRVTLLHVLLLLLIIYICIAYLYYTGVFQSVFRFQLICTTCKIASRGIVFFQNLPVLYKVTHFF